GDGRRLVRTPEHVHDVDRGVVRDLAERAVRALAEDLRLVRVDRHDPVAVPLEVRGDVVRGTVGLRGQPDDRDGVSVTEEQAKLLVLRRYGAWVSHGASSRKSSS